MVLPRRSGSSAASRRSRSRHRWFESFLAVSDHRPVLRGASSTTALRRSSRGRRDGARSSASTEALGARRWFDSNPARSTATRSCRHRAGLLRSSASLRPLRAHCARHPIPTKFPNCRTTRASNSWSVVPRPAACRHADRGHERASMRTAHLLSFLSKGTNFGNFTFKRIDIST